MLDLYLSDDAILGEARRAAAITRRAEREMDEYRRVRNAQTNWALAVPEVAMPRLSGPQYHTVLACNTLVMQFAFVLVSVI